MNFHYNKFERAVIFSDSKAVILTAASTETKISTEARDCQDLIRQLKGKHKTDRTAVDTRTLPNYRERTSRRTGQKGTKITQTYIRETRYHSIKLHLKQDFRSVSRYELETKLSHKPWTQEIILGWISRRWDVGMWTGLGWPRIERSGGRL